MNSCVQEKQNLRLRRPLNRFSLLTLAILTTLAGTTRAQSPSSILPGPKPSDAPQEWKSWIGDYFGEGHNINIILERGQKLWLNEKGVGEWRLEKRAKNEFVSEKASDMHVSFDQDGSLLLNDVLFARRDYGVDANAVAHISPLKPIEELRTMAIAAQPPVENGNFRKPNLVELAPLDPGIHLDIRYATTNDFLGTPVYSQARAFLQRPAAEALL